MKVVVNVRILIEIDEEIDPDFKEGYDLISPSHAWLESHILGALDWEQGDVCPEEEAPLQ